MKKIMYELEDVAPIFLIFGYFSLAIGAWEFISHLVTLSLSFPKIKDITACIVFGYLFVKFAHKIVKYNSIPPHVEGSIVDNNTADDTSEDTADIEAYIANELISEETKHRNSHDDLD